MNAVEILNKINNRFQGAKLFHAESSHLLNLLSLPGFGMLHEKQLVEESRTQMRLYQYIIQTYGEAPVEFIPESGELIQPLIKGRHRDDIKVDERRNILIKSWDLYIKWESDTLKLYQSCAQELFQIGNTAAYEYVAEIVKAVSEELRYIDGLRYYYENTSWDLSMIAEQQSTLVELYQYQIRELYKNYEKGHHYNSFEVGKIVKEDKHKK